MEEAGSGQTGDDGDLLLKPSGGYANQCEECTTNLDVAYTCTHSADMMVERKDSDERSGGHTLDDNGWRIGEVMDYLAVVDK